MSIERGGPSEEEMLKWEKQRILSDAELIRGGAKYKIGKNDKREVKPELEVTSGQIEEAREEMEDALEAPKLARELLVEINSRTDEQLDRSDGWRKVLSAIQLCKQANMVSEVQQLSKRMAEYMAGQFEGTLTEENRILDDPKSKMTELRHNAEDWLRYLKDVGDPQALEAAKTRIREVLDPDSVKRVLG